MRCAGEAKSDRKGDESMKIVIVGAGAMGCLFAALLRRAGLEPLLLEKSPSTVAAIGCGGLVLEDLTGTHAVDRIAITGDAAGIGPADYVVFFVKAFDTASAAGFAAACIGPATVVVTLQNGIGNADVLSERFPGSNVLAGITAHGATLLGPGHVRHAGCGETAFGPLHPSGRRSAEVLCDVFNASGIAARIDDDVHALLWGKLCVNIGINALAAILDISNGRILEMDPVRDIMRNAVREAVAVAVAQGLEFDADEQVARVEQVCRATQSNICSMLQDVRAGRMTEIEYINGAVVRAGRSLHCPVPVNAMLADLVRARQMLAAGKSA
ncbi:MAG: 2-dehydropantoate 2-reductase [Deltaproteobacteria bacterium]|nr:2-dehydropantoate 2-reductase [Deltaproteobacteria bacterium]